MSIRSTATAEKIVVLEDCCLGYRQMSVHGAIAIRPIPASYLGLLVLLWYVQTLTTSTTSEPQT